MAGINLKLIRKALISVRVPLETLPTREKIHNNIIINNNSNNNNNNSNSNNINNTNNENNNDPKSNSSNTTKNDNNKSFINDNSDKSYDIVVREIKSAQKLTGGFLMFSEGTDRDCGMKWFNRCKDEFE